MNFKRSLFVLLWLALMPVAAMAQLNVTPEPGTANVVIDAWYFDQNDEEGVVFTLQCTSGTYSPSVVEYGPGQSYPVDIGLGAGGVGYFVHLFVVADIPEGVPNECTVSATAADTYEEVLFNDGSCTFPDVQAGDVVSCINNYLPAPVDVDVTKVWETFGAEQADLDPDVILTLFCEPVWGIEGGTFTGFSNRWYRTVSLNDSNGDFDDEDDLYIGVGTAEFEVIPWWFPTAADPDEQEYTECWVEENASAESSVEVDNGCGGNSANAAINIAPGQGDECTITNTVFFEGIPTLSQYGMAIMVLLMLGVGFVGMRRIV